MGNKNEENQKTWVPGGHQLVDKLEATKSDIMHNAKLLTWPDGSHTLRVCSRPVYREEGWEERGRKKRQPPQPSPEELYEKAEREGKWMDSGLLPPSEFDSRRRSIRRAKSNLRLLCRANEFAWFITLTLSPEKVNRYDDKDNLRRLSNWLRNTAARTGLTYVLVPERHKDGALHFHGLINDALELERSGTYVPPEGGRPRIPRSKRQRAEWIGAGWHEVFNLPQWHYGFTTAIKLYGEREAAINYVCKYIGKAMEEDKKAPAEKIGGRWVYSGGPLKRPAQTLLDVDFEEAQRSMRGYDYTVKETGDRYIITELEENYGNKKD